MTSIAVSSQTMLRLYHSTYGTTARSYDELGRVIVKSVPNIGVSTFEYDLAAGVPAGMSKK